MTPLTDSPIRAPLRVQHIAFRGRGSGSRDFFTLESRQRVGSRIHPHCSEEFLGEGFQVDAMGVACIGHSMEDPDRTADAKHPVTDHNSDGRRPSSHNFIDRHLGIDGFRSVHGTPLQRRRSKPSAAPRTLRGRKQRAKGVRFLLPCDNSSLAVRRRGTLKVVFKMPLWCRDDAHTLPVAVERAKLLLLWAVAFV